MSPHFTDHTSDVDAHSLGEALGWITGVLEGYRVPYQVVGGLAARAYGARRPLVDIDIYVPFDRAAGLLEEIRPRISWGPERYVDDAWDITFLKIDHEGQRIELGDSSTNPRFFSTKDDRWETQQIEYENYTSVEIYGVEIKVMRKEELIRYKSALGREVDLIDIAQMTTEYGHACKDGSGSPG